MASYQTFVSPQKLINAVATCFLSGRTWKRQELSIRTLFRTGRLAWKRPGRTRGKDHCGQATKGVWRMSWRQKAMKGVEGCDKLGEAVKQALIPGFPNDRAPNP